MVAYQAEVMRVDRGVLREARSEFEAALRQLSQVDFTDEERDVDWRAGQRSVDSDSVKAVRFLDGRREVVSALSWTASSGEPWPLQECHAEEDNLTDCDLQLEDRQRKDSGFEVENPEPALDNNRQAHRGVKEDHRLEAQQLSRDQIYRTPPHSPLTLTIGPKQDLDWPRFSFLVRNNQLSFDEIADLVTRCTTSESNPAFGYEDRQCFPTTKLHSSLGIRSNRFDVKSGNEAHLISSAISPLEKEPPRPFSNVLSRLEAFNKEIAHAKRIGSVRLHHKPLDDTDKQRTQEEKNKKKKNSKVITPQAPLDFRYQKNWGPPKSHFSSDSSLASLECAPDTKAAAWWKKAHRKHTSSTQDALQPTTSTKANAARLWKRLSTCTPKPTVPEHNQPTSEAERKLAKKDTNTRSIASNRGIPTIQTFNHIHPALRNTSQQAAAAAVLVLAPSTSSHHITSAMRISPRSKSISNTHQTRTPTGKHRSSNNPSVSTQRISPHQPRNPLNNVTATRGGPLHVNKGLPPVPSAPDQKLSVACRWVERRRREREREEEKRKGRQGSKDEGVIVWV
ncbi:hypothetical protein BDW02DRAFT_45521 [Decorospora gaudefroyi]|uniref:Uncharacterized protein n=1 Tax=Decorospora gaudefroyi TaxID=184978 RepID=A0A6A5K1N9_9PLEO|nr:hypothetical protein BDW02DRAFT_45521 [Decorospora gaudefroyi]